MVARGDLGVEVPFTELPAIQKHLITVCRMRGKRVITTDGAPAWGDGNDYDGRLIYLKGYRDGTSEERVQLLKNAILKMIK